MIGFQEGQVTGNEGCQAATTRLLQGQRRMPEILNYIVAIYLILIGIIGLAR
jgi:hypothetical protein